MDVRSLKAHTFLILLDRWDWIMSRIAFTSHMMRNTCAHDDELERVLGDLNGGNDEESSRDANLGRERFEVLRVLAYTDRDGGDE